ncbi:MAG: hypothetical protein COT74_09725 [Bdellovibrionales bacterium CG10_big_fil_rev_8_21_14_0_10_45_34]|nr:MAG: hypothetical protein COT74_09725 [Bdellovibrionales bacterium CG10_big_fil_rev_8_21_14_0_10_45_34]
MVKTHRRFELQIFQVQRLQSLNRFVIQTSTILLIALYGFKGFAGGEKNSGTSSKELNCWSFFSSPSEPIADAKAKKAKKPATKSSRSKKATSKEPTVSVKRVIKYDPLFEPGWAARNVKIIDRGSWYDIFVGGSRSYRVNPSDNYHVSELVLKQFRTYKNNLKKISFISEVQLPTDTSGHAHYHLFENIEYIGFKSQDNEAAVLVNHYNRLFFIPIKNGKMGLAQHVPTELSAQSNTGTTTETGSSEGVATTIPGVEDRFGESVTSIAVVRDKFGEGVVSVFTYVHSANGQLRVIHLDSTGAVLGKGVVLSNQGEYPSFQAMQFSDVDNDGTEELIVRLDNIQIIKFINGPQGHTLHVTDTGIVGVTNRTIAIGPKVDGEAYRRIYVTDATPFIDMAGHLLVYQNQDGQWNEILNQTAYDNHPQNLQVVNFGEKSVVILPGYDNGEVIFLPVDNKATQQIAGEPTFAPFNPSNATETIPWVQVPYSEDGRPQSRSPKSATHIALALLGIQQRSVALIEFELK